MTLIPAVLRDGTNSLTLNWDFENKLTTADVGSDSTIDATYKWDALGRRVYSDDGTSAYVYVQVGQQTIADYGAGIAASTPRYRYVYASYIDEPVLRYEPSATETLYYHRNQQYSIIALTDNTGAITGRYAYSAYGEPVFVSATGTVLAESAEDNRYTYTGREWDEGLGLYHFRARMYDAGSGRFCGRDPRAYFDSYNLCEFLGGRALHEKDWTGEGIDSISVAVRACMRKPTLPEKIRCLENLYPTPRVKEAIEKLKKLLPKPRPGRKPPKPRTKRRRECKPKPRELTKCPPWQHVFLHLLVEVTCKEQAFSCGRPHQSTPLTIDELLHRAALAEACAIAAFTYQRTCFQKSHPDWPTHENRRGQAQRAARICLEKAARKQLSGS